MIFKIDHNYATTLQGVALSDLCCKMMEKGHFIDCDGNTLALIKNCIQTNASTTQTECFTKYKGFSITAELRKYLTTILVDGTHYSLEDVDRMVSKESRVLVENGPYEWDVYKKMMGVFERDRKYGNVFQLLIKARNKSCLTDLHCGGCSTMVAMIKYQEQNDYKNVFAEKSCVVFDRDTNDEISFDSQKNGLFRLLCNKDNTTVSNSDIYTLNQSHYYWHMWYKREIENYFTDDCYIKENVNVSGFPAVSNQRDYFEIDKSSAPGYDKPLLSSVAEHMSRSDYDTIASKKFLVNGELLSEIQLFLLKLVKII